jgi:xanthine dehydrogenase YagT iron-sulfur-binding subunit
MALRVAEALESQMALRVTKGGKSTNMADIHAEQAQGDVRVRVNMTVNGAVRTLAVEPRMTLLDALRDELALTGTKKSCDRGECGACTVHIEGRRVLSCMTLVAMHEGQRITTIEGLERDGHLHASRKRSLSMTVSSAVFVHPAKLCQPLP